MDQKYKLSEEWIAQAEYDMKTAMALYNSGRYIYAIYICHLSIEKALKGLFASVYEIDPPKTHNLNYLLNKIREKTTLSLTNLQEEFIELLNEKSVPARFQMYLRFY